MTTIQNIKENLSIAYVRAIAAKAGVNISKPENDYGIDLTLKEVTSIQRPDGTKRFIESGVAIDVQLKCSHNIEVKKDFIIYDLEAKTYNDLIIKEVNTQRILIVLKIPKNEAEWILQDEKRLEIRHCAYWISLHGKEQIKNNSSKRIEIPVTQKFTPEALKNFFKNIKEGVKI